MLEKPYMPYVGGRESKVWKKMRESVLAWDGGSCGGSIQGEQRARAPPQCDVSCINGSYPEPIFHPAIESTSLQEQVLRDKELSTSLCYLVELE